MLQEIAPKPADLAALEWAWRPFWARPKQIEPVGDWSTWLVLAGRGFGKTLTGAKWVNERVEAGARRVALVGATPGDVRDVMIEGESGILENSPPWNRPKWEPAKRRLTWPGGCVATTYSAEQPRKLRGPNTDTAWLDELAAWRFTGKVTEHGDALTQVRLTLRSARSGLQPRMCITTTPRPTPPIKRLIADSRRPLPPVVVTVGSTYENAANLAPAFFDELKRLYEGTRLGRQELLANILDDAPGALFNRQRIDELRVESAPELRRIVVAIDPAFSTREEADNTGIVVAGVDRKGHGYVLDDLSGKYPVAEWAQIAIKAYKDHQADRVVAEMNLNGQMVENTLKSYSRNLPFRGVRAYKGKELRAEPVAALYEQGKVHHVGSLGKLEDEMCSWEPGTSTKSPDRLDALVYALTELMVDKNPLGQQGGTTPMPQPRGTFESRPIG